MTSNPNDKAILVLQGKIKKKEANLSKTSKWRPKTNCSLVLNGQRLQINTLAVPQAELALAQLGAWIDAGVERGLDGLMFEGVLLTDYQDDLQGQIAKRGLDAERQKLNTMKKTLEQLLSAETRTALIIEEMAGLLDD